MRRRDCSLRHSPNGDFPSWAQRAGWVQLPRPNSLVHGWDEGGARLPRPQVFCRLIDPTEASPRRRTKTETIILSSSTPLLLHPTTTNRPRPPRQPSIRPAPVPLPSRPQRLDFDSAAQVISVPARQDGVVKVDPHQGDDRARHGLLLPRTGCRLRRPLLGAAGRCLPHGECWRPPNPAFPPLPSSH